MISIATGLCPNFPERERHYNRRTWRPAVQELQANLATFATCPCSKPLPLQLGVATSISSLRSERQDSSLKGTSQSMKRTQFRTSWMFCMAAPKEFPNPIHASRVWSSAVEWSDLAKTSGKSSSRSAHKRRGGAGAVEGGGGWGEVGREAPKFHCFEGGEGGAGGGSRGGG